VVIDIIGYLGIAAGVWEGFVDWVLHKIVGFVALRRWVRGETAEYVVDFF
jgi:hypothetical protein